HSQPEDPNGLFQKLLKDLKELAEYVNDNEDQSVQYKEYLENSSNEIVASNSNQEKEKPPQDSDIRQLIREECCIEVCEEQKQNMENTILELVEICRQKEFYCMHDNIEDLIESALSFKLLSINLNSQRLDKKKQEVKNVVEQLAEQRTRIEKSLQNFSVIHKSSNSLNNTSQISPVYAVTPILSTKEPEYSLSMGYEHPNTTPKTESDEIIKSGVEELEPIPNECEVTSKDKRMCDMIVCKDSSTVDVWDNHSKISFDSNSDDDISIDDNAFEDIEYVEASLLDPEIVSLEEENDVHQEEEEFDLEDIQDVVLREKLLSINRLIANIKYLNNNPTPDRVLNSFASIPIFEESDNSLFISDNSLLEFETFCDRTEEMRSGSTITHAANSLPDYDSEGDIHFLEALLIDDSIPFPNNEASDFDNSSFPRPPSEPPDAEPYAGKEILVVMNDNDELDKIDEKDDYFPFLFVI
nr:hypothetical protein [Tanacetum cinerariifolium]